jgi:hypothetical protein
MQENWLWGFDQFIKDITTGGSMKQRDYNVRIYFSGSRSYSVTAPDYEEAKDAAHDLFKNDCGDLGDDVEITDVESEGDD